MPHRKPAPRPHDPPMWVAHSLRFAFGAVFGFALGCVSFPFFGWGGWPIVLAVGGVTGLICGIAAVKYGDSFWESVGGWWR